MLQWLESSYAAGDPHTGLFLNYYMARNEALSSAQKDPGKCDLPLSFDGAGINIHDICDFGKSGCFGM